MSAISVSNTTITLNKFYVKPFIPISGPKTASSSEQKITTEDFDVLTYNQVVICVRSRFRGSVKEIFVNMWK